MTSPDARDDTSAPRRTALPGWLIWLVPPLAVIALLAWAFAAPVGAAPDDDFHLTSVWCANDARTDLCAPADVAGERLVPPAVAYATCFAFDPDRSAACQEEFFALDQAPTVVTERGNFDQNYPPVYYWVMNALAGPDLQVSALLMRTLNVLLFVGLITALAWMLPAARRAPLVAGFAITMVPLGAFTIASNNPSSWTILGVGTAWLALLGWFESTGRRRIALGVLTAVGVVLAAGSRGDGAIYVMLALALAAFLSFERTRRYAMSLVFPAVLAIGALLVFLSIRQSSVATIGLGGGGDSAAGEVERASGFSLFAANAIMTPDLWRGVFGGWRLGWLDTPMPGVVDVGAFAVFAGFVFVGFGVMGWRKALGLAGVLAVLWLLPVYVLTVGGNVVGENVQPRYLLPIIVVFASLALLPVLGRSIRLNRVQLFGSVAALAVANAFAMHISMRRYTAGLEQLTPDPGAGAEWWWPGLPLSPLAVWVIGSLAFAGAAAILAMSWRRLEPTT